MGYNIFAKPDIVKDLSILSSNVAVNYGKENALMSKFLSITILLVVTLWWSTGQAVPTGGIITLKNSGGDVVFNHAQHSSVVGQKCTACHDKLFTNVKKHKKVTMKEMQKGKSCGACHNGKTAFSVKGDCSRCHKK
jgi:c(7)-type cytochrome triheme protein